ncbi:MAG: winged helix-turn-helix transcriptional regulator, partial [Cellulomonas sp.]|nr:winged helix-turn-helix transcriptional regulator [Cellulomonas sp.]
VISRQAKQLCELGLVHTEVDPNDGRARYLAVTDVARAKLTAVRTGETAIVHKRLSEWPTDDLHQLAALLAQLNTP